MSASLYSAGSAGQLETPPLVSGLFLFGLSHARVPVTPVVLLLVGVLCGATSVVMIKASLLHPAELSAYRLILSAMLLSPIYFRKLRKYRGEYSARHLLIPLFPALMLALHFITWAQGAQWTHAANATLIVSMVPVVMPFLLFFTIGEKITASEIIGTVLALGGAVWLTSSDFAISRQSVMGDITCFVSMLLFSIYLAQARMNRDFPDIWLYLVPLYATAGAICFVVALFVAEPLALRPLREYLIVCGLAVIPTILGHSILNYAMRHLRGQIVSVINLLGFIFAAGLAYVFFGEVPRPVFYAAGALVVGGCIVVIHSMAATAEGERAAGTASTPEV